LPAGIGDIKGSLKNNLTFEVQIKSTEYLNFRHFRHFEF